MRSYEKKTLIKFMSIYMVGSFILFSIVAVLYYFDQRNSVLRELQDEMIAYISLTRNGNNTIEHSSFVLDIQPSKQYQYPVFYEDSKTNKYISITCASQYQPDKVFIVSAEKSVVNAKLYSNVAKILTIMGIGFIPFFGLAFYLARLSIRPIEQSRNKINNIIEDVIHDLNAPMSAISMNCEFLESALKGEKELQKVDRISRSNKTIGFLYNNLYLLLDHTIPLKKEIINISELLKDRVEYYRDLHPEATLSATLPSAECVGDSAAFERIIDNLLSNAIKYSQPNPKILVKYEDGKIIIEDNGIGVKDCEAIFRRNYRETQGKVNACGLGLGLSIVKKLCDEMEIRIEQENNKSTGSRFIIYCPK